MTKVAHIPYGYKIVDGKAVINEIEAKKVKKAYKLYLEGKGLQEIGRTLDFAFKHPTIGRILKNQKYLGDDFYPKLIDEETYRLVQNEREARVELLGRNKNYFSEKKEEASSFWHMIYCKECGSVFRRYSKKKKLIWKCSRHIVNKKPLCKSGQITDKELESACLEIIKNLVSVKESIITRDFEDKDRTSPELDEVEKRINQTVENSERKKLLYKRAEIIYAMSEVEDFQYQTEKLLKAIDEMPESFNEQLMKKVIRKIIIDKENGLSFELINGKEVNLYEQDGVGDTC